jgi:hypothetical protein
MTEEAPESGHTEEALNLIDLLIKGDKGYDIFRGEPQIGWDLLPKALREEFKEGDHLEALSNFEEKVGDSGIRRPTDLRIWQLHSTTDWR